jgi:UDP-N-acetylglucosamine 2-epimerase (non-hydrolysing)
MATRITLIVGARPNFMKAAPLVRALRKYPDRFQPSLIHTGQHYDAKLSQLFFDELGMEPPDLFLGVGSSTHAQQTAAIMIHLEKEWMAKAPDLVVVFGDVNSTMAAALVAAKLQIKLAHVEAGLRSFDHSMPEEVNRIVTDRLSDYMFVSEQSGLDNLAAEGVDSGKVFYTGNIMIDSLISSLSACEKLNILDQYSLRPNEYAVVTMHRPSNVDDPELLGLLLRLMNDIGRSMPVVFPCHPRTRKEMDRLGNPVVDGSRLQIIEPVGYLEFLRLQSQARFVLTDSGGIQEETTYLQIPCITMRTNTERPATSDIGSNVLTGPDPVRIRQAVQTIMDGKHKRGQIPPLWDGHTAERIVGHLLRLCS